MFELSTISTPQWQSAPASLDVTEPALDDHDKDRPTSLDYLRGGLLTIYLQIVFYILQPNRKIRPQIKLGRMLRRAFARISRPVPLANFEHNGGHCYTASVDGRIPSDFDGNSCVCVYENDRPLATAHADHLSIREKGLGRYSHWNGLIYFSTSDNSDPSTNGRRYTFCEIDPKAQAARTLTPEELATGPRDG